MNSIIRRGGRKSPSGFLFELSGGNVALDLVNTLKNRQTDDAKELIPRALDFVAWAAQSGLLKKRQEEALRAEARRNAQAVESVYLRAIQLRECLYLLFSSVADGEETTPDVLAEWNQLLRESSDHYETVRAGDGLAWQLRPGLHGFDTVLWRIIHSALELLTGPQATRIRRCAGDRCDWLFLDTSKRGNRRWCDMTVCGNQAKARRFYQRKKSRQTT